MKTKNLSKITGLSESITVEWKESLSDTKGIMKSISAFSNNEGGKIVACGTPEEIVKIPSSYTGQYLKEHLI